MTLYVELYRLEDGVAVKRYPVREDAEAERAAAEERSLDLYGARLVSDDS